MRLSIFFGFGSILSIFVNGGQLPKTCEGELTECMASDGDRHSCSEKLKDCIDQNSGDEMLLPDDSNAFMKDFKCCFQSLTTCIHKEKPDVKSCSDMMMRCSMRDGGLVGFRKKAPKSIMGLIMKYRICRRENDLKNCVFKYHTNMENIAGKDCLGKYISCSYSSPQGIEREECHNKWKSCMGLGSKCSVAEPLFRNKLSQKIWNCRQEAADGGKVDKHVFDTLRCILDIRMVTKRFPKHYREKACLLVHQDDEDLVKSYRECVGKR